MTAQRTVPTLAIAGAFTALFLLAGWRDLNPYAFRDLESYRIGFESQWYLFQILNSSAFEFFISEGAWVITFDALYRSLGDIEVAFTIVSAAAVFLMSWYVIKRTGSPFYLLFFINPAFISLAMEQIRSGLASGFFYTAVLSKNAPVKIAFLALAASFHTAFFLLGGFYLGYLVLNRFAIGERMLARPGIAVAFVAVLALIATVFRGAALEYIGDVRGDLVVSFTDRITLSVAFASFILTYILFTEKRSFTFEVAFYTFCVMTALISVFAAVYGVRFIGIGIPALAVMASGISPRNRIYFIIQYAALSALYFWYWLQY